MKKNWLIILSAIIGCLVLAAIFYFSGFKKINTTDNNNLQLNDNLSNKQNVDPYTADLKGLYRYSDSPMIYAVFNRNPYARPLPTKKIIESYGFTENQVIDSDKRSFETYPTIKPYFIMKKIDDEQIYLVINGQKHAIPNFDLFKYMGFAQSYLQLVNETEFDYYPTSYALQGVYPAADSNYYFTQNLKLGSEGQEVLQLSMFLKHNVANWCDFTEKFDDAIRQCVERYQVANHIAKESIVGPRTREYLNGISRPEWFVAKDETNQKAYLVVNKKKHLILNNDLLPKLGYGDEFVGIPKEAANIGTIEESYPIKPLSGTNKFVFTHPLNYGDSGEDVLLLSIKYMLADTNCSITDYFNNIMERCTIGFQEKNKIAANGIVDQPTLKALNE